jgi:REP-associated tyrosine transposase
MSIYDQIQSGKIKRCLRSRYKLNYQGLISHITQRAVGDTPLFLEESDYLYMLKLLKETSEKFSVSILAFCLMTNHLHILIKQKEKNLSKAMHSLFMRYAVYFNNKYKRKGHLFSGAFRQAACFDDYYLLAASVYIHLNPVRAGISAVYQDYRWSSWRLYCRKVDFDTFINWRFILGLLNEDIQVARGAYLKLLEKSLRYRQKEALEYKKSLGRFGVWIKKTFPELIKNRIIKEIKSGKGEGDLNNRQLDKVIKDLCKKKRLSTPGELKARSFAVRQLKSRGYSIQEIMDELEVSRATVYNSLKK